MLGEQSLAATLEEMARALQGIVSYTSLAIYEVDQVGAVLVPLYAAGVYVEQTMASRPALDGSITGHAVTSWQLMHLEAGDPRLATRSVNVWRDGEVATFEPGEAQLLARFAAIASPPPLSATRKDLGRTMRPWARTGADGGLKLTIVVGYDGSDSAKRALDRAAALAGDQDQVVVVAVWQIHARTVLTEGAQRDPSEMHQRGRDLEEAKAFLAERGIEAETVMGQGDPGEVIVNVANEKGADLIVLGRRGLNPLERILLGSVCSKVVHRASCDVLIVH